MLKNRRATILSIREPQQQHCLSEKGMVYCGKDHYSLQQKLGRSLFVVHFDLPGLLPQDLNEK
jgi:hypothetical protein